MPGKSIFEDESAPLRTIDFESFKIKLLFLGLRQFVDSNSNHATYYGIQIFDLFDSGSNVLFSCFLSYDYNRYYILVNSRALLNDGLNTDFIVS